MLQAIDTHWREHLAALDHLRQGIHLRGYAQKNPKQEYKREAFELFEAMLTTIRDEVTGTLMTVRIAPAEVAAPEPLALAQGTPGNVQFTHADFGAALVQSGVDDAEAIALALQSPPAASTQGRDGPGAAFDRVGRNDACPCGSGKKYKHCHGKLA
jgi:preprotein translocase subunit SecA